MAYIPILLVCLAGLALFLVAVVLPRRRAAQEQTIDLDPTPPRSGDVDLPGSRPDRAEHGKP